MQLSILAASVATLLATAVHGDVAAIKAVTKCAEDNDIKMEVLMKACDQVDMSSAVPGYKCFSKCTQQIIGVMDESGKFNPEKSAAFFAEEDKAAALEVAEGCAKDANAIADLCERAHGANMCMFKKSPELYKKSCLAIMNKMMST